MKKLLCLALCLATLLCGCSSTHSGTAHQTEMGFIDDDTDIEYVACNLYAIKPIGMGEVYCEVDGLPYYEIDFQEPSDYLCDLDPESGSSYVYRNKKLPDIDAKAFDAIAAWVSIDGKTPVRAATLYADDEYLDESLRGQNDSQDTDKVKAITKAIVEGEHVSVSMADSDKNTEYEFRLLSNKFPGLYYSVWFFSDAFGKYYFHDYVSGKTVVAPSEISAWIAGSRV